MAVDRLDLKTVRLVKDELWMDENPDLTLFTISSYLLETWTGKYPGEKGIQMSIVLKRKLLNELMTTYLPSGLLIMITFATTFFKPSFFEAALSVNLTTMLVLTTLFVSVMERLPSTAYIKMIDIWLVFCQLVPFTEVILLTMIEYRRSDEFEASKSQAINHHEVFELEEKECGSTANVITDPRPAAAMKAWQAKNAGVSRLKIIGRLDYIK